jgi:hypothetical protein
MPTRIFDESEHVHTWDRQPGESQRAYEAFKIFRGTDVQTGIRVMTEVARLLGCSLPNIHRWSRTHNWIDRAAAFDTWREHREVEARELASRMAIKRVAERWADHRIQFLERYMRSHMKMLERVEQMLEYPIYEVRDEEEVYPDGRACKVTVVNPARWRARDMALITKNLILSMREVMDMMEGPVAAARAASDEDMDPDEASAAIRAILDARARKAGVPGPVRQPGVSRPHIPESGPKPG